MKTADEARIETLENIYKEVERLIDFAIKGRHFWIVTEVGPRAQHVLEYVRETFEELGYVVEVGDCRIRISWYPKEI